MNERKTRFFEALCASSASACSSLTGAGSVSARFSRIAAGTVRAVSSSSEPRPSTWSIPATSLASGPMWRVAKSAGGWSPTFVAGGLVAVVDSDWDKGVPHFASVATSAS